MADADPDLVPAVGGGRTQPGGAGRAAAVRRVDSVGQSTPQRALSCWIVSICTTCREKAKAFIRKPENAKPGEVSPAAKLARSAVTVCVLCGVLIVPTEAAEGQALPGRIFGHALCQPGDPGSCARSGRAG